VNVNKKFIAIQKTTSKAQLLIPIALMDPHMPKDCGPPPPTAVYPDIPTAFAALQSHATSRFLPKI